MSYLYLRPDENVLAGRTTVSVTGTPDADHPLSWLTDLRTAFPIRYPSGAWKVSTSVASRSVKLVVLANHSLDANVTLGGTASGTIVVPAAMPNGVRSNPFVLLGSTVPSVTTLTLEGTNTQAMILGEAFAGVPRVMRSFKMSDMHDEFFDGSQELQGDFMNIPMHDEAREWRVFGGTQAFTTSECSDLIALWQAQRGMSLPIVLIVNTSINDARIVQMARPIMKQAEHKDWFDVTLLFVEYPRYRWI